MSSQQWLGGQGTTPLLHRSPQKFWNYKQVKFGNAAYGAILLKPHDEKPVFQIVAVTTLTGNFLKWFDHMASPPFFLPKNSSAYAPELVWLEQTWRIASCSPWIWKGRATCMHGAGILNSDTPNLRKPSALLSGQGCDLFDRDSVYQVTVAENPRLFSLIQNTLSPSPRSYCRCWGCDPSKVDTSFPLRGR
jgi:hypothetical protein